MVLTTFNSVRPRLLERIATGLKLFPQEDGSRSYAPTVLLKRSSTRLVGPVTLRFELLSSVEGGTEIHSQIELAELGHRDVEQGREISHKGLNQLPFEILAISLGLLWLSTWSGPLFFRKRRALKMMSGNYLASSRPLH